MKHAGSISTGVSGVGMGWISFRKEPTSGEMRNGN